MNIENEIAKVISNMSTWEKLGFIQEQMRKTKSRDEFRAMADIQFELYKEQRTNDSNAE